jgi:hypothetical protein
MASQGNHVGAYKRYSETSEEDRPLIDIRRNILNNCLEVVHTCMNYVWTDWRNILMAQNFYFKLSALMQSILMDLEQKREFDESRSNRNQQVFLLLPSPVRSCQPIGPR